MPTEPVHFFERDFLSEKTLTTNFFLSKKGGGLFKFTHKIGPANITGAYCNIYRQDHFKLKTFVGAEIEIEDRKEWKKNLTSGKIMAPLNAHDKLGSCRSH